MAARRPAGHPGRAARWVHVAPLARTDFPAETLAALARGRRLSLDGAGPRARPARPGELRLDADYDPELLAPRLDAEAERRGGRACSAIPAALLGVPEVVVTHGSRGSTVYVGGRAERVPALPRSRRDPTGAGDAFSISYVAARSAGLAPAAAARRATAVVGAVLAAR